jgi:outer membrane protein
MPARNLDPRRPDRAASAASPCAALALALALVSGCALGGAADMRDDLDRLLRRGPDAEAEAARPPAPRGDLAAVETALEGAPIPEGAGASIYRRAGGAGPAAATPAAEVREGPPLELDEALRLAEGTLEGVMLAGEDLHRAHLARLTALSSILPNVSWRYTYTRSEPDVTAPAGVRFGGLLTQQRLSRFELRQPLFDGESWGAIAAAGPFVEAAEARVREQRRLARRATVLAYFAVLAAERVAATFEAALARDDERLEEARAREAVGVARRTEVLFIETDRARAASQLVKAREDVEAARAALALAIGRPARGALAEVAERPPPAEAAAPVVARAFERRPDLEALRSDLETWRRSIYGAWGRMLPGVDLTGNLYTHREGTLEDVDWDLSVELVVPIFEGFAASANLRDVEARYRQARLAYEGLAREVAREVTRLWHDRRASRAALESQRVGLAAAEENFRLLEAEYREGIATNLELVTAEQQLRLARLDLEIETLVERRLAVETELATGGEP